VVLGHAEYYPKFGFVPASRFGVTAPFPVDDAHFMAIELVPRVWQGAAGRVVYPDPFET
jgi:putative acetyltransferase